MDVYRERKTVVKQTKGRKQHYINILYLLLNAWWWDMFTELLHKMTDYLLIFYVTLHFIYRVLCIKNSVWKYIIMLEFFIKLWWHRIKIMFGIALLFDFIDRQVFWENKIYHRLYDCLTQAFYNKKSTVFHNSIIHLHLTVSRISGCVSL